MKLRVARFNEAVRASLWFIPTLCVVFAIVLAVVLVHIDRSIGQNQTSWVLFGGGADSARGFLSTIAASMITFTGLVFSITMLVLQLASAQLSPRVMRTFLRDRKSQFVLGVYVATFVYALFVVREIRSSTASGGEFVPALATWSAFAFILLSIALFIYYINHIAHAIQAVTVIGNVGDETRAAISRLYPAGIGTDAAPLATAPQTEPNTVIAAPGPSGVVTAVDEDGLRALAYQHQCTIALVPMMGDFVREGSPLLLVWGEAHVIDAAAIRRVVSIAAGRTMQQDVAFGFRQLVDIGERALSPGINDPTTAVQVLDQLHDLLGRLMQRAFPSPLRLGDGGQLLLVLPCPGWESYVMLALDELRQYGSESIQIARRLRFLLADLLTVAPAARRPALERQARLLDASILTGFTSPDDQDVARSSSPQGHGALHDGASSGTPS